MRISDWSSDVCSSDLGPGPGSPAATIPRHFSQPRRALAPAPARDSAGRKPAQRPATMTSTAELSSPASAGTGLTRGVVDPDYTLEDRFTRTRGRIYLSGVQARSEEQTSELQSLVRNSYAVFCLKKKNKNNENTHRELT